MIEKWSSHIPGIFCLPSGGRGYTATPQSLVLTNCGHLEAGDNQGIKYEILNSGQLVAQLKVALRQRPYSRQ